jgi:hypothetical protein
MIQDLQDFFIRINPVNPEKSCQSCLPFALIEKKDCDGQAE